MRMVQTVTGCIHPSKLGHCQLHEHLYVSDTPAARLRPELQLDDITLSTLEAIRYKKAGGTFIVDCQPVNAGRDVRALERISRESGIYITACTGYHLPGFYHNASVYTAPDSAYDLFIHELRHGCTEYPQSKPGAVKAAVGPEGCTGSTLSLLKAAACAAYDADVPLIIHTDQGHDALSAIGTALRCGLMRSRILICHADRRVDDLSIHEAIAGTGVMLEYDTVSRFRYHDNAAEVSLILHMLEKGYEDQILLSLDTTRERLISYGGSIGLDHLLTHFLPMLVEYGISPDVISHITNENPLRVFA